MKARLTALLRHSPSIDVSISRLEAVGVRVLKNPTHWLLVTCEGDFKLTINNQIV